jgi:hypoxanthine phosphoribosyltransferase
MVPLPYWHPRQQQTLQAGDEFLLPGDAQDADLHVFMVCTEEEIAAHVGRMAEEIAKDYSGMVSLANPLILVNVLEGGTFLSADLARALAKKGLPVELASVSARGYDEVNQPLEHPEVDISHETVLKLRGRHCLLVDDMTDSGGTFSRISEKMKEEAAPASIASAALIARWKKTSKYAGMVLESKEWLYGYGLDGNGGRGRALPFICAAVGTGQERE